MNDFKTPVDSKQFAEAMYYFASSVHIIATDGEYGKRAVTISSCSPLSYDPPTLLVCLQKAKEANQIFLKNKSFTVNTINESYKEFADICGGRTGASQDDRFNNSYWKKSKFGTPILDKAHLSFECVLDRHYEYGTHYILISTVLDVFKHIVDKDGGSSLPLIYSQKKYHSF